MLCANCGTEHEPSDLYDGDRCHYCALDVAADDLARKSADLGVPPEVIAAAAARRPRRAAPVPVVVETYEDRDVRLVRLPGGRREGRDPWSAAKVSKRLDLAVDNRGQSAVPECPVCRRQFRGGRADRVTCSDHCRDLARRVRQRDPTVEASLRMLFEPPPCAGCGGPLWGKRPDARHHGAACVKRAQRARARPPGT
jgi:hypothetical protein